MRNSRSIYRYESFIDVKAINVYLWLPCKGFHRRMPTPTFKRVAQLCEGSKIYYRLIWIILSFPWIGKWINPLGASVKKQKYCFGAPETHSSDFTAWSAPIFPRWFQFIHKLTQFASSAVFSRAPCSDGKHFLSLIRTFWLGWLNAMKQILNYPRLVGESVPLRIDLADG